MLHTLDPVRRDIQHGFQQLHKKHSRAAEQQSSSSRAKHESTKAQIISTKQKQQTAAPYRSLGSTRYTTLSYLYTLFQRSTFL